MIVLFNFVYRKIRPPICVLMSILLMITDGFTVHGPSGPLVVSLGSSVVLPCYVDKALSSKGLEVEWRRTDSETLVHLYQDGKSLPEAQQQDYHDRAHFFTDQIQYGNFSLRLDKLRAEDEGKYTCKVYTKEDSGETVVTLKSTERLLVSGSSRSISVSVGEDVTLNCSVDSHIPPTDIEEVSWKKTDEDENILVLLYQNNKALPEAAHEQYRDRVEFFTDEIPKGNFSLRLKSVRSEDKGVYMCQAFAGGLSANATVVLERLGFSVSHIIVFILCITASGSALLLCFLIYCRSPYKGFTVTYFQDTRVPLGSSVVLPCYVDKCLLKKSLKVEWRRTTGDSETLVHLYQDGESRAETQQQEYHDRAHFFTDQIQHGNFSLRLDNLITEDEGEYTCRVYSPQDCVFSTTIILELDDDDYYEDNDDDYDDDDYYEDNDDDYDDDDADNSCLNGFTVRGPSGPLVVPLRSSVVLPCSVPPNLLTEDLEVKWRRTDSDTDSDSETDSGTDSETLVHLYQDGESRPEKQHKDYHDRAHFFTDQIQHGNFSLRLDNLRAEDEGKYTCKVYNKERSVFSTETDLEPKLIDSFLRFHLSLVFCPNMIIFFAFVFWGVSEGSVNETVCCCALYFLRPLLILWAAPYINEFTGKIKTWILNYSYVADYVVFSVVAYSALFATAWQKLLNFAVFDRVVIIVLFSVVFLCCFCKIIHFLVTQIGKKSGRIINIFNLVADMISDILPTLQFVLLFYTFGSGAGFIIIIILPMFMMMTNDTWIIRCRRVGCSLSVRRTVMIIFTLVMNAAMIGVYIMTLEKTTDPVGWGCVLVFLQILWTVMKFTEGYYFSFDEDFHRFVPMYVFGSVGFILLTSAALITELILKTVNGDRTVGDLRFIVFPVECFFAVSVLISGLFASKIKNCLTSCQTAVRSRRDRRSQQKTEETEETQEMKHLKTEDQEETQPDSVVSQT